MLSNVSARAIHGLGSYAVSCLANWLLALAQMAQRELVPGSATDVRATRKGSLGLGRRPRTAPDPTSNGYDRPDCFHHSEGPRAQYEAVKRAETASKGKRENKPVTLRFESVEHQHRGHRKQTEGS